MLIRKKAKHCIFTGSDSRARKSGLDPADLDPKH